MSVPPVQQPITLEFRPGVAREKFPVRRKDPVQPALPRGVLPELPGDDCPHGGGGRRPRGRRRREGPGSSAGARSSNRRPSATSVLGLAAMRRLDLLLEGEPEDAQVLQPVVADAVHRRREGVLQVGDPPLRFGDEPVAAPHGIPEGVGGLLLGETICSILCAMAAGWSRRRRIPQTKFPSRARRGSAPSPGRTSASRWSRGWSWRTSAAARGRGGCRLPPRPRAPRAGRSSGSRRAGRRGGSRPAWRCGRIRGGGRTRCRRPRRASAGGRAAAFRRSASPPEEGPLRPDAVQPRPPVRDGGADTAVQPQRSLRETEGRERLSASNRR